MATKHPLGFLKNGLGPRICIAYDTREELDRWDLVTNLHIGMHDAFNVIIHTAEVNFSYFQKKNIEELRKK